MNKEEWVTEKRIEEESKYKALALLERTGEFPHNLTMRSVARYDVKHRYI